MILTAVGIAIALTTVCLKASAELDESSDEVRIYDYVCKLALKNTGDIPATKDCLIATEGFEWYGLGDVPHVGGDNAAFKTRKEAVDWWNKMIAKAKKNLSN